eukprot:GEMP01013542.1.p1 GENE.GEMP01013542.1~~GEMP01013542.1.p1  ORF type:complete len:289 (+),score=55.41 GEMP01013542.1:241-1107(+)
MRAWLSLCALVGPIISVSAAGACGGATDASDGQCDAPVPVRAGCGSNVACQGGFECVETAPGADCSKNSSESECKCLAPMITCGSGQKVLSCSECLQSNPLTDKKAGCVSSECAWNYADETCDERSLGKFAVMVAVLGPFTTFLLFVLLTLLLITFFVIVYDVCTTDCHANGDGKSGWATETCASTSRALGRVTYVSDVGLQKEMELLMLNRVARNNAVIGSKVVRGPHWTNGNEDGGIGCTGTLVGPVEHSWLVKWDNGGVRPYEIGDGSDDEQLYELSYTNMKESE